MTTTVLEGLENDNLLGFIALLGMLRALDAARPSWSARVSFGSDGTRPHLRVRADVSDDEIAAATTEGCAMFADRFVFAFDDLTFDQGEARSLLLRTRRDPISSALSSSLCSDIAIREETGRVQPTPFCAMFGQGHQSFLKRLDTVSKGTLPRVLQGKKHKVDLNGASYIARALFSPWTRSDATESFRWDHEEDRRYALRAVDPSADPATTEHGANRLAALGLLSFQSAPRVAARNEKVNLETRAVSRGHNRRPRVTWPVWRGWASLEAIHAMLDHPELAKNAPSFDTLERHGILFLQRVERRSVGKFLSFSRAIAVTRESVARQNLEPRQVRPARRRLSAKMRILAKPLK